MTTTHNKGTAGTKIRIKWSRRAQGWYEAVGYSGIPLVIVQEDSTRDAFRWSLYAGDRTDPRARRAKLSSIKAVADSMFG